MNLRSSGRLLAATSLSLTLMLLSSPSPGAIELVGTTEVIFDWTPASGTVTHYGVYVAYDGDDFPAEPDEVVPPSAPWVTLEASYGETLEIRVAAFNGPLRGPFSEISESVAFIDPRAVQSSQAYAATHGPIDLDGDGFDDVVYFDSAAEVVRARLSREFVADSKTLAPVQDGPWRLVARGDYDGDGRDDLFWRNLGTGDNRIWFLDGLTHEEAPTWPVPDLGWRVLTASDFDGDERADLLWHHVHHGWMLVWTAGDSPTGHVFTEAIALPAVSDSRWEVSACGDFDGDGHSDLFWSRENDDQHRVWLVDLPGVREVAAAPPPAPDFRVRGVGDYDGDGKDELLWRNVEDGWTLIRYMSRPAAYQDEYLRQLGTEWVLAASGDLNGDGRADLVWNREDGSDALALWLLKGTYVFMAAEFD